ncbi:MAG: amino acid ABC transporter permease [Bdellovibrionota bacterium]
MQVMTQDSAIKKSITWCRENLFSSPTNGLATVILLFLLIKFITVVASWLFFNATFVGDNRDACNQGGACWVFIKTRIDQFIYGFYPNAERWRVNLVLAAFASTIGFWFFTANKSKRFLGFWTFLLFPILSWNVLRGSNFSLTSVETAKWGGVFLTLMVSTVGIVCSLPLGIILALGRQSKMPAIKTISVLFIELWRGVPLITVLFMSSVMLPLFFPEGVQFDKLLRALIGVALFSSAYMAEVVRGGLQAIPKGQFEAAQAIGLSYWQSMRSVIMPQALKMVIPGIVNTFIGLFKDTTLVAIIGMFDLLGIIQAATTDPDWLGFTLEGYVFAAIFFWLCCYTMSKYSQFLERKLHTGH